MSSSCASLKSVVIQEWVKAEPRASGCGVSERSPEPLQRRLSFSMPRLSSATQEGLVSTLEKMFLFLKNYPSFILSFCCPLCWPDAGLGNPKCSYDCLVAILPREVLVK